MRIPLATYRLQLNKGFTLRDATALVPYLDALGVSDVYASPFLAARAGSLHGYDVVDPTRLNPEIGSDQDLDALAAALRERGMGLLMDLVPNHMCIAAPENRWWTDVLENGRSSPYARIFDIDWHPPKSELAEKVLLPVLGEQYGRVLEEQQIAIEHEGGAFLCRYGESRFPVGPRTVRPILEPIVADLRRRGPDDAADLLELESILTAVKHLPTRWETAEEQIRERQREKEIVKRRIAALIASSPDVRDGLGRSLATLNGCRGEPRSFDALEALLADQAYRLSFWGVAAEEINYRRFFDINELAAIRIEDPQVMELVHAKPLQLVREGKVTGLRIDHVDGLLDPARYLSDLQAHLARPREDGGGDDGAAPDPFFVVVEKILLGDERLPADWAAQGTTGYEFLNAANDVFVDGEGMRVLERIYQRIAGGADDFDQLVYAMKKLILDSAMSSELYVLSRRLDRISEQHRWSRDFTASSLHRALGEVVASFPVYRSYVGAGTVDVSPGDRRHILAAVRNAKRRNQSMSRSIFDFIGDIWLLRDPEGLADSDRVERRELVTRLQQLTGPVMAKGLEDTAFYRHYPLASLNEVGGGRLRARGGVAGAAAAVPGEDRGVDPAVTAFHRFSVERAASWPHSLSATATHDTKRGEDARARLDALSEAPRPWQATFRRWQRLNRRHRQSVDEMVAPDANEEYLLYQTLVGAWPMDPPQDADLGPFTDRICGYMNKALKEAKLHTSWINANEPYEHAVETFIRLILAPHARNLFLRELASFAAGLALPGLLTSLAQTIVKVTAPGVPDFFQGTELWDQSLVDPDNRRPVDYQRRLRALAELDARRAAGGAPLWRALLAAPGDGAVKLHLVREALQHRRRWRALYDQAAYLPLRADGPRRRHVLAFARLGRPAPAGDQGGAPAGGTIVVVGRLFLTLARQVGLATDGAAWIEPPPAGAEPPSEETSQVAWMDRLAAAWIDSFVTLDPQLDATAYRDVLSGRLIRPEGTGARVLPLREVFADMPGAILEPVFEPVFEPVPEPVP